MYIGVVYTEIYVSFALTRFRTFALDKQVNENQTVFSRLSALLSGVVVSLAGRQSTTEAQDHVVRMFWSNTLPYIEAIIDQ